MKTKKDQIMHTVVSGRTLDDQIDNIRKEGSHGTATTLRNHLLRGLGIYKDREKARNLVIFGCYLPFGLPWSLRSYLKLLDRLGLDYTFLEREICCGLPLVETNHGPERERAVEAAQEFAETKLSQAREAGAEKMVYFCHACAYWAKRFLGNSGIEQVYYPDILLDAFGKESLHVEPTTVGYYQGCHRRGQGWAHGMHLNYPAYRKLLNSIQGLELIDLTHSVCCVEDTNGIIQEAENLKLDTILCSCSGCHTRISEAARGRLRMKYLPDLLLEALENS
ncbi:heterodisulfide reductase-related iron-sulfur binding cluster [Thermodesulfobacteriota bacterium]